MLSSLLYEFGASIHADERACSCFDLILMISPKEKREVIQSCFCGQAESAIVALNCSGMVLGSQPIRWIFNYEQLQIFTF